MKSQFRISRNRALKLITTFFVLAFITSANAALISQDLSASGDGLITYDSATGLSWLDAPLTAGRTYAEVASGFGGYTTNFGFRYATEEEVTVLFSNAGVVQGNIWGYWNYENPNYLASGALSSLLGQTYREPDRTGVMWELTFGILASSSESHIYSVVGTNYNADSFAFQSYGTLTEFESFPYMGSFLVRESSPAVVPLPSALWLFMSGLGTLVGLKKLGMAIERGTDTFA
ncbi:MAG: hypothetical protein P8179_16085 [Candidatus Thiodiazotropha sp.]|jgi:hypothetical protein